MIRVDKMAQQAKEIRKALQPVFFLAMVEAVKAGWVVVIHLWYGNSSSYKRVPSVRTWKALISVWKICGKDTPAEKSLL